jgi:hypothetical protein
MGLNPALHFYLEKGEILSLPTLFKQEGRELILKLPYPKLYLGTWE